MAADRREKSKLGQIITIITSVAAIATAFASWYEGRAMEEQQTVVSRDSYNALAASVRELAEENKQRHEEIAHLKGFIDGFKLSLINEDSFDIPPMETESYSVVEESEEPTPRVARARVSRPPMAKKAKTVDLPSYEQIQQKSF